MRSINPQLIKFLREPEVQECIDRGDWEELYRLASISITSKLTRLLYRAKLDPLTGLTRIPVYFLARTSIKSFTIPDTVKIIGSCVFESCTKLESITIPDSVTSIGGSAFDGCSSLTSINIPDNVTYIGDSAFSACSSLESVIIGNSIKYIGYNAFTSCRSLEEVTFRSTITEWARVEKAGAFNSDIIVRCSDGNIQLLGDEWVKI